MQNSAPWIKVRRTASTLHPVEKYFSFLRIMGGIYLLARLLYAPIRHIKTAITFIDRQ